MSRHVLYLSLGVLAAHHASTWNALLPVSRGTAFVAGYSYTLYLIHFPVLIGLAAAVPASRLGGPSFVLAGCLAANAVSILCWAAFERHFTAVRKWMDQHRSYPWAGSRDGRERVQRQHANEDHRSSVRDTDGYRLEG